MTASNTARCPVTKDGVRDKIGHDLRLLYGNVADEPVPDDMKALLAKLK